MSPVVGTKLQSHHETIIIIITHVDMQRPEIPPKLLLLLQPNVLEILIAEDDDAALGDEQRELVLLEVVELRELQPADLGADDGGKLVGLDGRAVLGEQVQHLLVGDEPAVVELEGLKGGEGGLFVVDGEVGRVFVLVGG